MNRERLKGLITGIVICSVLFTSVTAFANTTATRQVLYGVSVMLNGQPLQLAADSQPFIMEGRTFLPVRAIADAVGMPVYWDQATWTVWLGTRPVAQAQAVQPPPQRNVEPWRQAAIDFLSQHESIFRGGLFGEWLEFQFINDSAVFSVGGVRITDNVPFIRYNEWTGYSASVSFHLYDLDNSGIPQIVIWYGTPYVGSHAVVYKFVNGVYREAGGLGEFIVYRNQQGQLFGVHGWDSNWWISITLHNNEFRTTEIAPLDPQRDGLTAVQSLTALENEITAAVMAGIR